MICCCLSHRPGSSRPPPGGPAGTEFTGSGWPKARAHANGHRPSGEVRVLASRLPERPAVLGIPWLVDTALSSLPRLSREISPCVSVSRRSLSF